MIELQQDMGKANNTSVVWLLVGRWRLTSNCASELGGLEGMPSRELSWLSHLNDPTYQPGG